MPNKTLDQRVSSEFAERFAEVLETETMRQKIICVFNEEIKKREFVNLIKEYAGEEMDSRIFRSAKYWFIVIITALITSGIGVMIGLFTKR